MFGISGTRFNEAAVRNFRVFKNNQETNTRQTNTIINHASEILAKAATINNDREFIAWCSSNIPSEYKDILGYLHTEITPDTDIKNNILAHASVLKLLYVMPSNCNVSTQLLNDLIVSNRVTNIDQINDEVVKLLLQNLGHLSNMQLTLSGIDFKNTSCEIPANIMLENCTASGNCTVTIHSGIISAKSSDTTVIAASSGATVQATARLSKAKATALNAVARSTVSYAYAEANAEGAIANVSGSVANAKSQGAIAQAKASGAIANSNVTGAISESLVDSSIANANYIGSTAQANGNGAIANATAAGSTANAIHARSTANATIAGAIANKIHPESTANATVAGATANSAVARAIANVHRRSDAMLRGTEELEDEISTILSNAVSNIEIIELNNKIANAPKMILQYEDKKINFSSVNDVITQEEFNQDDNKEWYALYCDKDSNGIKIYNLITKESLLNMLNNGNIKNPWTNHLTITSEHLMNSNELLAWLDKAHTI